MQSSDLIPGKKCVPFITINIKYKIYLVLQDSL